jgi:hypothetical protein
VGTELWIIETETGTQQDIKVGQIKDLTKVMIAATNKPSWREVACVEHEQLAIVIPERV